MKVFLLTNFFTFVSILILLSSSYSNADSLNNSGFFCKPIEKKIGSGSEKRKVFYFTKGSGYTIVANQNARPIQLMKELSGIYVLSLHYISWCTGNSFRNTCHEIDRQSLK